MKIKKIFAAVAATAVAASMTAVTSFASETIGMDGYTLSDEYGNYMDMLQMYTDVASVATCEITITDSEANGCAVVASESTGWAWNQVDSSSATDNGDGTFTYVVPCTLAASDTLVKITVQDWDEVNTLGVVSKVVLKDASGNVLAEVTPGGAAEAAPAADTTEEAVPAETTAPAADTSTTAAATGNTAVASIVAVMTVAGVAVIASRKRK